MKTFGKAISIMLTLFAVWAFASLVNVSFHNMTDQTYAAWNLFTMIW